MLGLCGLCSCEDCGGCLNAQSLMLWYQMLSGSKHKDISTWCLVLSHRGFWSLADELRVKLFSWPNRLFLSASNFYCLCFGVILRFVTKREKT